MDPVATLSNEHGPIRQYLDNLTLAADRIENGQRPSEAFFLKAVDFARDFADGYVAGDPMKTSELLENVAAYCTLLRHHIHIEDHVFFPMAKKVLTPDEIEQLSQEFVKQREKTVMDMGSILSHLQ